MLDCIIPFSFIEDIYNKPPMFLILLKYISVNGSKSNAI